MFSNFFNFNFNFQELPPYKETLEVTFKTGVCFNNDIASINVFINALHNEYTRINSPCTGHFSTGSDRNFALLENVFRKFPHIAVNIEVKENNTMLIEKVRAGSSLSTCFLIFQTHLTTFIY